MDVATEYLGAMIRGESGREREAYETYSLSFLVVRSSGSLPRRPTRTSFARSYDRAGVEENVCCTSKSNRLEPEDEHLHVVVRPKMRALQLSAT